MNDDWKNEISNIKKTKNNKIRFIISPKEIIINNKSTKILLNKDLGIISVSSKKLLPKNFIPESRIDLHGYTRDEAHNIFNNYIKDCYNNAVRRLLVITGKGTRNGGISVLKKQINIWINNDDIRPYIISYFQASSQYGGDGAFIILLRKKSY